MQRGIEARLNPCHISWQGEAKDPGGWLENRASSKTPRTWRGATDVAPLGKSSNLPPYRGEDLASTG